MSTPDPDEAVPPSAGLAVSDPKSPPPASPSTPQKASWRSRRAIVEWSVIIGVAIVVALVLRLAIVQPFYIPSGSMEPTLKIGDKVLVNKLAYDFHSIHRGDVVVFNRPPNDETNDAHLIKRVIGLSGESISGQNGMIYINGRPLAEPWLPKGVTTSDFAPVSVPPGDIFVMGDNRGDSADSRVFGPISKKLVIGRAFVRILPLSRIGTL